jgi:segregation and condensation protein B
MTNDRESNLDAQEAGPSKGTFENLKLSIESLLFSAGEPLDINQMRTYLDLNVSVSEIRLALKDLCHDYQSRSFELVSQSDKYCLRTREKFTSLLYKHFQGRGRHLSKTALETLAIVAYRQPVTRAEVNAVRQVDSSSIMSSLKERGLIQVAGVRKEIGLPLEYQTTPKFLEVFHLKSLKELPSLRSLQPTSEEQDQIREALAKVTQLQEDSQEVNESMESNTEMDSFSPARAVTHPHRENLEI